MTKTGTPSFEEIARQRVADNAKLYEYYRTIFYDWDNWQEHMEWIATAPVSEIVDWAETVEAQWEDVRSSDTGDYR